MSKNSTASELKWLTLDLCVDKWSNEGYKITCSEALQFCSEGKLKVSCHLSNRLARPVYEFSPLLDDGYYQRVARMVIAKEDKKSDKDLFPFSLIDGKESKNTRLNISSEGFAESFFKQRDEYQLRLNNKAHDEYQLILNKAKEIFSRWKEKGMSKVSFEYGSSRMLTDCYQLAIDKELADCLTRMALNYDILTLESLCVVNDDGERLQLVNNQEKPEALRLNLGDLIIQRRHRIEFENEHLQDYLTESSSANEQTQLSIDDFFSDPPKNWHDVFAATHRLVSKYIKAENSYPSWGDLWTALKKEYDCEGKSIPDLSRKSGGLTQPHFRKRLKGWGAKKTE